MTSGPSGPSDETPEEAAKPLEQPTYQPGDAGEQAADRSAKSA